MRKFTSYLVKTAMLLIGILIVALLTYDVIAVRPHLAQIESVLNKANQEDASPPQLIRDLIDANAGTPTTHATQLVIWPLYADLSQGQSHIRYALWRVLLPMHLNKPQMYGIYASLSFNGIDRGLSNFAQREYGKSLSQLTPIEAATTVAMTQSPSAYVADRAKLALRANLILERSQLLRK
jgi:hypothetical protein